MADSTAQAEVNRAKQEALAKSLAAATAKTMESARRDSIAKAGAAYRERQKSLADSASRAQVEKAKEQELAKTHAAATLTRQLFLTDSMNKAEQEKTRLALLAKTKEDADAKLLADDERRKQQAAEKAKTDSAALASQHLKEKEDIERRAKIQADILAKKELLAKTYEKGEKNPPSNTKQASSMSMNEPNC